jgi:hypothetical protein
MSQDDELDMIELDDMDAIYTKRKCPWCLSEPEWECYIFPGRSAQEPIKCPVCGNELGFIRADLGKTVASKGEFKCSAFVAATTFTSTTKDKPLLCQWCNWFCLFKLCKHPDDPKKFARDDSKRPTWFIPEIQPEKPGKEALKAEKKKTKS